MPTPDLSVIGRRTGPVVVEYESKDVILYALGVGAGIDELDRVYEGAPGGLRVLPSFCVVMGDRAAWPDLGDVDHSLLLHGEQRIVVHRPLPPSGRVVKTGEVTHIFDKGKGALYVVRMTGALEDGTPLFETESGIFYVGAGGFGGDRGPGARTASPPDGVAPDFSVNQRIGDDQAALYRLCGDLNPLHIDPEAARRVGFDRPILHGLCTYGFAVRAILDGALDGDVGALAEFGARFSGVVFPGDTLTTEGWRASDGWIIQACTANGIVLSNGLAKARSD